VDKSRDGFVESESIVEGNYPDAKINEENVLNPSHPSEDSPKVGEEKGIKRNDEA